MKLLQSIESKTIFKKEQKVSWHCRNCGHIIVGEKAPELCPVCKHPQAYFEVAAANY